MPVVYKGIPGTGQGDLFQGLKLWVAQRVPQRTRWVDLVKGNGGEVVRLEKYADMLIADNIKVAGVSPPPGSYMWRWIDDSIKNGFLQDKDDYLIGHREGSARQPVPAGQTRAGRTPFTKKDDLIVTKWVLAEERRGNAVSGNVVYKALERRHPHHTWQSWRDRWVKTLRNRPRPEFSDEELQAEINEHCVQSPEAAPGPADSPRRAPPIQAAQFQPQSTNAQPDPATPPSRAPKPAAPANSGRVQEPKGRSFFTSEEDRLLLKFIEQVRQRNRSTRDEEDKYLGGNVIYQDFAKTHPSHSWHSWRNRWVRHLSLREAVDDAGPDEASSARPKEAPKFGERRTHQLPFNGDVEVSAIEKRTVSAPGPSSTKQQPDPKSDDQRLKRKQRERREARAALLIEKAWRGHAVRRDMARLEAAVVPLQSLMRGYVARMRTAHLAKAREVGSKPGEAHSSQVSGQHIDAEEAFEEQDMRSSGISPEGHDPREQFYADLEVIMGAMDLRVDREPTINGQRIDLWDLYRLARQQECELEIRNWKLITEGLGFQPVNSLVWKVQACYLQNLAEFEHHIMTFECNDGMNEGEVEEAEEQEEIGRDAAADGSPPTSDAVTAPKQPVADPLSPEYRSSPPIPAPKRSFEHTDLLRYGTGYPSSEPRKRRRMDRTSVIPPTPDEKIGLSKDALDGVIMQDKSSPLKSKTLADGDAIEIGSGDESDELQDEVMTSVEGQDELPSRSDPPRKTYIEPETQDWPITQYPLLFDDEADVSPSQQLQLESDAVGSPDHPVPDKRVLAASNAQGFPGPPTRVTRSTSKNARVPVALTNPTRASVNSKVTKRKLPDSYRREPASAAAANATASVSNGKPVLRSRPQLNGTTMAVPSSKAPVRTTNGSTYIATPATQPATNRSPMISSLPIKPQLTRNKGNPTSLKLGALDDAFVEAQISHFQALGYKDEHISQAMQAATMSRGPMIVALQSLAGGNGIPQNEPGVWTPRDCSDLRRIKKYELQMEKGKGMTGSADGKTMTMAWKVEMAMRLEKKHGKAAMEQRWEFMNIQGMT